VKHFRQSYRRALWQCLLCLGPIFCMAGDLVPLSQTWLFTHLVKDCADVDLQTWHHATRDVLVKRKVVIERVALCNDGKYPVFYVQFPYDPQGQTRDYFGPLYFAMEKANGGWPLSFVDATDNTVVSLTFDKRSGAYRDDAEMYRP